jgi:hypothetical protein
VSIPNKLIKKHKEIPQRRLIIKFRIGKGSVGVREEKLLLY